MPFDKEWNESVPEGTETIALGDDRIRDFKYAIRERLAVTHHFYANEAGIGNIGEHKDGVIKEQHIANGAITTNKMPDEAVTDSKLAKNSKPMRVVESAATNIAIPANTWITIGTIAPTTGWSGGMLICRYDVTEFNPAVHTKSFRFLQAGVPILEEAFRFSEPHSDCRMMALPGFFGVGFEAQFRATTDVTLEAVHFILIHS